MVRCALALALLAGCYFRPEGPMVGGAGDGGMDTIGDGRQDWLSGFAYRKKVTIRRTPGPSGALGTLVDFPLSFDIHDDADLMLRANAAGNFSFTAADGKTTLANEIVSFRKMSGDLEAWVKMPMLPDEPSELYMYYGGTTSDDPLETWTAAAGVWHMNNVGVSENDVSGHLMTLSGPDVSKSPDTQFGFVGAARLFDGADDRLCRATGYAFGQSSFSYSVWVEAITSGAFDSPFHHRAPDNAGFEISLGTTWYAYMSDGSGTLANVDLGLPDAAWLHIAVVVQRVAPMTGTVTVFRNGNTAGAMGFNNLGSFATASSFCLGDDMHRYKGKIDEARIYLEAKPQAWFFVEHDNVRNRGTFMTFGNEEALQ